MSNIRAGAAFTAGGYRFEVKSRLSKGGFGEVWEATRSDAVDTIGVVIKVPLPDAVKHDPKAVERFQREAGKFASLGSKSRNIVKQLQVVRFESDGELIIVQERVVGARPVRRYLDSNPEKLHSIFLQALYALRALKPTVVHRDVSPNNVLVGSDGVLKLIDFGLAKEKAAQSLTSTGWRAGTDGYMAPELINNFSNVDHRADQWSMGMVFAAHIQQCRPVDVRVHRIEEPFASLLSKMVEFRRSDRFENPNQIISDAMSAFAEERILLPDFASFHIDAMDGHHVQGWGELAAAHFMSVPELGYDQLAWLTALSDETLADPTFDVSAVFERFEESDVVVEIARGFSSYESADSLANAYRRMFLYLDGYQKLRAIRRVTRAAVSLNRFPAMDTLRAIFRSETDLELKEEMARVVTEVDRRNDIYRRDDIPARVDDERYDDDFEVDDEGELISVFNPPRGWDTEALYRTFTDDTSSSSSSSD